MKESKRLFIRSLSGWGAGIGALLALGWAGTGDFREELRYQDEETRAKLESRIVSQKGENALGGAAAITLVASAIGLAVTEKNQKSR